MIEIRHSEETRKKMRENYSRYWQGKTRPEETRKKMSEARNTTGFYRISKQKNKNVKQGFMWCYRYQNESTIKSISRVNLLKLKEKVEAQNLLWEVIDKRKAQKSLEENNRYHHKSEYKMIKRILPRG